ncbi:unnamed protein product [Staurois parvus]|uniref:Uncharacterized protein n=1 Tax=Staurois parvus TaxID=386267 RepID=A0ABN9EZL3_9NEOB|nr:unnamed protein product [Staurois parvus]
MGPPGNRGLWGPCVLAKLKKAYEKDTRGISWGPLLTPGPRAVPEFPNESERKTRILGWHQRRNKRTLFQLGHWLRCFWSQAELFSLWRDFLLLPVLAM